MDIDGDRDAKATGLVIRGGLMLVARGKSERLVTLENKLCLARRRGKGGRGRRDENDKVIICTNLKVDLMVDFLT